MTISQVLTRNMENIRATTREGGWKAHHYHTEMFGRLWGHLKATELTRTNIEEWANVRKTIRSQNTVKHELGLLRRAFNLAYREELIPVNPFARVKVRIKPQHRHQLLAQELEDLLAATYGNHFPLGDLLWTQEKFALLTGLRIGEQVYLTPEHIREDICIVPEEGKTGTRLVPMSKGARAIGELWIEISQGCGSKWLFWPNEGDNRKKVSRLARERFARARLIASVHNREILHYQRRDFRRRFACDLIDAGVPIYEVQKILGHATTAQTQVYCQVGFQQLREAVKNLDKKAPAPRRFCP